MRVFLVLCVLAAMSLTSALTFAQAAPSVRGLTPFSAQTRYMSLAGYLRWQYFRQNKTWISMEEAQRLVAGQQ